MFVKAISVGAVILFVLGLAGCNTIAGAGQDVEKAGQSIEKGAEKHKPY